MYKCVIEFGHTLKEYKKKYGVPYEMGDLWDFPYEECFDGTIELKGNVVLWYINGRLYETEEKIK